MFFFPPAVQDPRGAQPERDRHRPHGNGNPEDVQAGQHGQQGQNYKRQQRQPALVRSVYGQCVSTHVRSPPLFFPPVRVGSFLPPERQKQLHLRREAPDSVLMLSHVLRTCKPHPVLHCMYRTPLPALHVRQTPHPQPPQPRPTLNLASEGRLSNVSAGFLCRTFSFAAGMSVTCETCLAISRLPGWIN